MKWVKCRNPKLWICDNCNVCGGCLLCDSRVMYHKGEESLCAACFSHRKDKK